MPIKHYTQNRNRRILDEKTGKKHTMVETSKLTGIPYDTIYTYIVTCKCTTFSEIYHQRDTRHEKSGFAAIKKALHDTKFGKLTLQEIFDRHQDKEMTMACLSCRLNRHGGMNESLWDDKKRRVGGPRPSKQRQLLVAQRLKKPVSSESSILEDFDRNTFCRRGGFRNKCSHYEECGDCRAFVEQHHERYREDGKCFQKK